MEYILNTQPHRIEVQPNIWIFAETLGDPKNPAVILFSPGGGQCIQWPELFCKKISETYFVIRFDYRDAGESSFIDYEASPYDLNTLFSDGLAVLDFFKIKQAHFIGNSLGGIVLQYGAMMHPQRMKSMVLLMTSPHHMVLYEILSGKAPHYFRLSGPAASFAKACTEAAKVPDKVDLFKIRKNLKVKAAASLSGAHFEHEYWYHLEEELLRRTKNKLTQGNQGAAQKKHPENRCQALEQVMVPSLVLHGKLDAVFPPDHAEALAKALPHAKLMILPDLGHSFDPHYAPQISLAILTFYESLKA